MNIDRTPRPVVLAVAGLALAAAAGGILPTAAQAAQTEWEVTAGDVVRMDDREVEFPVHVANGTDQLLGGIRISDTDPDAVLTCPVIYTLAPGAGVDCRLVAPVGDADAVTVPISVQGVTSPDERGVEALVPVTVSWPVPTPVPTAQPQPTPQPVPTPLPNTVPTKVPTLLPNALPTKTPTRQPYAVPTKVPTPLPYAVPTKVPTPLPYAVPTKTPTPLAYAVPTKVPTRLPYAVPTSKPVPEVAPATVVPTTPTDTVEPNDSTAVQRQQVPTVAAPATPAPVAASRITAQLANTGGSVSVWWAVGGAAVLAAGTALTIWGRRKA